MRKILFLIIFIISLTNTSNASFGSISSLDLYNNIDKGINDLQNNMNTYELEGGKQSKGILKGINKLAKNNQIIECLDESKNLQINKFNQIIENGNANQVIVFFNEKCQKDKETSIQLTNTYYELFKKYSQIANTKAQTKSEQIYKLSQIGIYADGNLNNSGFDLINDIEDIDKIIFAHVVDYEGEDMSNIDKTLDDFLKPLNNKINDLTLPKSFDKKNSPINKPINNTINNTISSIDYSPSIKNHKNSIKTENTYICPTNLDNSGLSNDSLKGLLNNIDKTINGNNIQNNKTNINKSHSDNKITKSTNGKDSTKHKNGNYEKVVDNSQWPCESFFCIQIDFTTYEHNLFGGGEDITIEYLINRSNKHLSKAVSTSLVQAKMGTNNFELGLKDLSLPDIFHLSIQVSTKPVPILNIEKKGKKDESELSSKHLLEQFYKSNGLDYKKRNDLYALEKVESDKQNINNSAGLSIAEVLRKNAEVDNIYKKKIEENNTIMKTIESKVSYGVLSTFEEQYNELEKFTLGINNYTLNLQSFIQQLRKTPIEY